MRIFLTICVLTLAIGCATPPTGAGPFPTKVPHPITLQADKLCAEVLSQPVQTGAPPQISSQTEYVAMCLE